MHYFTDENDTGHSDYEQYCRSIWAELSPALKMIQGGMLPDDIFDVETVYWFHDGRILSYEEGEDIVLKIGFEHENDWKKINLVYKKAEITKLVNEQRLTNTPEEPNNDIMCHELIKINSGYTHSFLFASGEELQISFLDLEIK